MKKWLSGCYMILCLTAAAQKKDFTLSKLLQLTQVSEAEMTARLARQDFLVTYKGDSLLVFHKTLKKTTATKSIAASRSADKVTLLFTTHSAEEFGELAAGLQKNFSFPDTKNSDSGLHQLYQKGSICVKPLVQKEKAQTLYSLAIEHKLLPQPQQIRFVEDLLQLSSHEYLVATFGENAVKKDQFYFSEAEASKCSMLFPHTARQLIIVWKDEVNNRDPSLLIVGNTGMAAQAATYKPAAISAWQSATGVYAGMPLKELEQLNGGAVQFYGWQTDEPGVALQKQKGTLNFKKFGVQLQCLDCNEDSYYSKNGILSSDVLLRQNRRAYVALLVMKPDRLLK